MLADQPIISSLFLIFTGAALAAIVLPACEDTTQPHPPVAEQAVNLSSASDARPSNVIFLIGDGMGAAQVKAYRMYADDPATPQVDHLPFEQYLVGAVSTDSVSMDCPLGIPWNCERDFYGITDSASSTTAYATGADTVIGSIAVDTSGRVLTTVLEEARMRGKSTGLVVTSQITHATPASFATHVKYRSLLASIADQYFDNQWNGEPVVQVLLGGGMNDLRRGDRDLVAEFREAGYQVALNVDELLALRGDRLLGLFAPIGLPRYWDRDAQTPTLEQMTAVALNSLSGNPEGFFLMVEGSQIDWSSHDNDIAGVISEMESFSSAIDTALEFAAQNGETLVLITADHETGGLSLGAGGAYRFNPRPLRGMTATPVKMVAQFMAGAESLEATVSAHVPFQLSNAEKAELEAVGRDEKAAYQAIVDLMNRRTLSGWTTSGHTGADVPFYAYGPGSENFRGLMENETVGQILKAVFIQ